MSAVNPDTIQWLPPVDPAAVPHNPDRIWRFITMLAAPSHLQYTAGTVVALPVQVGQLPKLAKMAFKVQEPDGPACEARTAWAHPVPLYGTADQIKAHLCAQVDKLVAAAELTEYQISEALGGMLRQLVADGTPLADYAATLRQVHDNVRSEAIWFVSPTPHEQQKEHDAHSTTTDTALRMPTGDRQGDGSPASEEQVPGAHQGPVG